MFQALGVSSEIPRIDLAALHQIIHLAASTLDLEVVRQHQDVGKEKKRALDALVYDSSAALKRFKGEEGSPVKPICFAMREHHCLTNSYPFRFSCL